MSPDRARRRVAALCLPVLTAGLLAACAAEDEAPAGAPTTTAAATTAAATTAAAASTSTPAASTTAAQNCANPIGLRTNPAALAGLDAPAAPRRDERRRRAEPARDNVALPRPFSTSSPWNAPQHPRRRPALRRLDRARLAPCGRRRRRRPAQRRHGSAARTRPAAVCQHVRLDTGDRRRGRRRDGAVICRQRNCGRSPDRSRRCASRPASSRSRSSTAGTASSTVRGRRLRHVASPQRRQRHLLPVHQALVARRSRLQPAGDAGSRRRRRRARLRTAAVHGMIQPNELRRGRIEHALAISVPGAAQRIFMAPASVTNGVNVIGSLPEGARLRLKSAYTTRKLPRGANRRSAEALITALRTYGAIVVDRSITPTLYARRSSDSGTLLLGNELQGIRLLISRSFRADRCCASRRWRAPKRRCRDEVCDARTHNRDLLRRPRRRADRLRRRDRRQRIRRRAGPGPAQHALRASCRTPPDARRGPLLIARRAAGLAEQQRGEEHLQRPEAGAAAL